MQTTDGIQEGFGKKVIKKTQAAKVTGSRRGTW
jgi:hypothetical protein